MSGALRGAGSQAAIATSPRALLTTAGVVQVTAYATFFHLTPLYPSVGADLAIDAGALGALVGFGGIVAVAAQLPAGSAGDALGRRPFFALGLILALVGLLLRWQAYAPIALLVSQIAAGAALGIISTSAFAVAAERFASRQQAHAIGLVNICVSVGQVVGYLVAGVLAAWITWRTQSLVMALLPACVLLVILAVPRLVPGPEPGHPRSSPMLVLRTLVDLRRLAFALLAALTLAVGQGACYLLPFAVEGQERGPLIAAVLLVPYVVGSIAGAPVGARLASRYGSAMVTTGALLLGIAACVAAGGSAPSVALLALCNVAIGASVNSTLPLVAVRVVSLGGVGAGTAIGGMRVGQSLGAFVGPSLAGLMLARSGADGAWLSMAACGVLAIALHAVMSRTQSS